MNWAPVLESFFGGNTMVCVYGSVVSRCFWSPCTCEYRISVVQTILHHTMQGGEAVPNGRAGATRVIISKGRVKLVQITAGKHLYAPPPHTHTQYHTHNVRAHTPCPLATIHSCLTLSILYLQITLLRLRCARTLCKYAVQDRCQRTHPWNSKETL